jgi:leucyl aminopeptidase
MLTPAYSTIDWKIECHTTTTSPLHPVVCVLLSATTLLDHPALQVLNTACGGLLAEAVQGRFHPESRKKAADKTDDQPKADTTPSHLACGKSVVLRVAGSSPFHTLVLVSLGKDDTPAWKRQQAVNDAASTLAATGEKAVSLVVGTDHLESEWIAESLFGMTARHYHYDAYRTKLKPADRPVWTAVDVHTKDPSAVKQHWERRFLPLLAGVTTARDLVTLPPNLLYPESYADRCLELRALGLEVEVLTDQDMQKWGMGALLGVAQGSTRPARLVVLRWKGAEAAPLAFVGKGVTFDTGGISIKPSNGMEDMKYDMAGSAAVVGLLETLARQKAPVHAVGLIGLVENMPDGFAQRPSDVVKTMSGQTVEVLNTDAEGRLVLADVLTYAQRQFKPALIVNLATLTGAIVVSLGDLFGGLFSNNDNLAQDLIEAGEASRERLWRFPLDSDYDAMLRSEIADMANISQGRGAGSITAAQFLQRFIENGTPWAHLDIAGMAWTKKPKGCYAKGATAFGVRLLETLVQGYVHAKRSLPTPTASESSMTDDGAGA